MKSMPATAIVMAITEVISSNKTPDRKSSDFAINSFELNPKQTDIKTMEKRDESSLLPIPRRRTGEYEGEGP